MTRDEIEAVLQKHRLWLSGDAGGECANLTKADLTEADLRGAYNFRCTQCGYTRTQVT